MPGVAERADPLLPQFAHVLRDGAPARAAMLNAAPMGDDVDGVSLIAQVGIAGFALVGAVVSVGGWRPFDPETPAQGSRDGPIGKCQATGAQSMGGEHRRFSPRFAGPTMQANELNLTGDGDAGADPAPDCDVWLGQGLDPNEAPPCGAAGRRLPDKEQKRRSGSGRRWLRRGSHGR